MDIKAVPSGTRCLVDSNILLYHISGASPECKAFLRRIALGEIEGYVTTVIIAEVLHRQMLIEAVSRGLVSPSKTLNKLKDNPNVIKGLSSYIAEVEKLLQLPLNTLQVEGVDISHSHALRQAHGLFVNDSINLARSGRAGLTDIVTRDNDFASVPDLNLWAPTDI